MSSIDSKQISALARLAALDLDEQERASLQEDLPQILEYVNRLSQLSSDGVQATSHVHGIVNTFRDDIIKDSLDVEQTKENAPDFAHGGFRVPKVI